MFVEAKRIQNILPSPYNNDNPQRTFREALEIQNGQEVPRKYDFDADPHKERVIRRVFINLRTFWYDVYQQKGVWKALFWLKYIVTQQIIHIVDERVAQRKCYLLPQLFDYISQHDTTIDDLKQHQDFYIYQREELEKILSRSNDDKSYELAMHFFTHISVLQTGNDDMSLIWNERDLRNCIDTMKNAQQQWQKFLQYYKNTPPNLCYTLFPEKIQRIRSILSKPLPVSSLPQEDIDLLAKARQLYLKIKETKVILPEDQELFNIIDCFYKIHPIKSIAESISDLQNLHRLLTSNVCSQLFLRPSQETEYDFNRLFLLRAICAQLYKDVRLQPLLTTPEEKELFQAFCKLSQPVFFQNIINSLIMNILQEKNILLPNFSQLPEDAYPTIDPLPFLFLKHIPDKLASYPNVWFQVKEKPAVQCTTPEAFITLLKPICQHRSSAATIQKLLFPESFLPIIEKIQKAIIQATNEQFQVTVPKINISIQAVTENSLCITYEPSFQLTPHNVAISWKFTYTLTLSDTIPNVSFPCFEPVQICLPNISAAQFETTIAL